MESLRPKISFSVRVSVAMSEKWEEWLGDGFSVSTGVEARRTPRDL